MTKLLTAILLFENRFNDNITATLKASFSAFDRDETTNTNFFSATQNNFYSEASLSAHARKHVVVAGINVTADVFTPSAATPVPVGGFSNTTQGVFLQDTWKLLEQTKIEVGLRADHHNDYERQSKYENLYSGTVANPVFKTLWAPIDGRVLNVVSNLLKSGSSFLPRV
jgi:outer membrane receptor for ferrienterochelin and colicin